MLDKNACRHYAFKFVKFNDKFQHTDLKIFSGERAELQQTTVEHLRSHTGPTKKLKAARALLKIVKKLIRKENMCRKIYVPI